MVVQDVMTSPVVSVLPSENYQSALRLMQSHHVHHLPVIDNNGRLCGIIAERDMLQAASAYMNTIAEVELVMRRDVVTVSPTTPAADAARVILSRRIGCLPVTDGRGQVVGIVTEGDLLAAMLELMGIPRSTFREEEVGNQNL
ncbi:MAG: CBS domain-containing protein [Oscillochloris sp.]|nr:CBS domain-containing protein [Oscillochloris sp.]